MLAATVGSLTGVRVSTASVDPDFEVRPTALKVEIDSSTTLNAVEVVLTPVTRESVADVDNRVGTDIDTDKLPDDDSVDADDAPVNVGDVGTDVDVVGLGVVDLGDAVVVLVVVIVVDKVVIVVVVVGFGVIVVVVVGFGVIGVVGVVVGGVVGFGVTDTVVGGVGGDGTGVGGNACPVVEGDAV
jgi:hypothetical protein